MIEGSVEGRWKMARQRDSLLEIYVDTTQKDTIDADVFLVGTDGRVSRNQLNIDAEFGQSAGQCIIVEATTAEHSARAGGEVGDSLRGLIHRYYHSLVGQRHFGVPQ